MNEGDKVSQPYPFFPANNLKNGGKNMAEFTWKIEELKYKDMTKSQFVDIAKSGEYSLQEMQNAMDEYGDIRVTWNFIWGKHYLWENDGKNTVKKQKSRYGREENWYNTNSLNAWCKKNGISQGGLTNSAGSYRTYGYTYVNVTWETEDIIKQVPYAFADFLEFLQSKERKYFEEHDDYTIKVNMINDNLGKHLPMPFDKEIGYYVIFNGEIHTRKDDNVRTRKLTLEELDKIIIFQNAVATAIKNVFDTQNPNILV